MDKHEHLRSLPLRSVMSALGIDLAPFKKRSGKPEWYGPCPFHGPKQNQTSFSFSDTLYHCFSCGVKGRGALDLVKEVRKCTFTDAVAFLEGLGPVSAPENPVQANSGPLKPYSGSYHKYFQPCAWLSERIPDPAVLERYGVGYYDNPKRKSAFSKRIMLPVRHHETGELYGYLGRSIDDEPKYLFPKGLPKHLFVFGAYELWKDQTLPHRVVYLVESPFCVLKYACLGLPAVSPFGWSVSSEQLEILRHLTRGLLYLPDRNKRQDALTAVVPLLSAHLWVKCPELPGSCDDPENLTLEQIRALLP